MPLGLPFFYRFYVMNDRDEPISVVSDVEDDIIIHIVGVLEDASHVLKFSPPSGFHNSSPFLEFVSGILVGLHRLF